jgi:hypothetical protein
LALNIDLDGKGICTASRKYQEAKLAELDLQTDNLDTATLNKKRRKITEKACLCVGLANASYLEHGIPVKGQPQGVVICPGPNLAYFNKEVSLSNMLKHIYGGASVLSGIARPHMFIKELQLYIDYLDGEMQDSENPLPQQQKKWDAFRTNLTIGISYYENLFQKNDFNNERTALMGQLFQCKKNLERLGSGKHIQH